MDLHWKQLEPNPLNKLVRGEIDQGDLKGLAQSIKTKGVIQPLTVIPENGHYRILTGERRWRAVQLLGDEAPLLPCVIVTDPGDETDQLITMGVENLQRQNLPPITEARYYQALTERGLSIKEIARWTGARTSRIKSMIKLLGLPAPVQENINSKRFPLTQVKTLNGLPDDLMVEVVEKCAGKNAKTIEKVVRLVKSRSDQVRTPRQLQPKEETEVEVLRKFVTKLWAQLYHGAKLTARMSEALADAGNFELAKEGGDWAHQIIGSTKGAINAVRS